MLAALALLAVLQPGLTEIGLEPSELCTYMDAGLEDDDRVVLVVRAYDPPPGDNPQVIRVNLDGRDQFMAMLGAADGFNLDDRFKHRLFLLLPPVGELDSEGFVCADVSTMIEGGRLAVHLAIRSKVR